MALADGLYRETPGLKPEAEAELQARFRALRVSRVWTRALATTPRVPVPWLTLLVVAILPGLAWVVIQKALVNRGILAHGEFGNTLLAIGAWITVSTGFLERRQPRLETMAARIDSVRYGDGDEPRSLTLTLDDGRTVFVSDHAQRGKVGDVGVAQFAGDVLYRFLRAG